MLPEPRFSLWNQIYSVHFENIGSRTRRLSRSACGASCAQPRSGFPDELHLTILRVAYPTASRWPRAKQKGMPIRQGRARQYDHATRPRGYDYSVDTVHSKDMESRRADYRSMHFVQQIFTASIIWLCRGGKDNVWLGRVPCTWLAAEALQYCTKAALSD
jgi:hypothetical protein